MIMNTDISVDVMMQTLFDQQQIRELIYRYCRSIDRYDKQTLRSVYHPDAVENHGVFNGSAMEFFNSILLTTDFRFTDAYSRTQAGFEYN